MCHLIQKTETVCTNHNYSKLTLEAMAYWSIFFEYINVYLLYTPGHKVLLDSRGLNFEAVCQTDLINSSKNMINV